ncbi:unnamed protein product [Auanema sp. JU1783]|nr:unnamed protein product [Auanema sp. JU1783]
MTDGSLAQLLEKASSIVLGSVSNLFRIHSIYCYNLSEIDVLKPTNYRLQKVRDGRNFTIRFVEISQKEKPTQVFEFSLQNVANVDVSVTYTPKFPDVKPPASKNLKQKSFNDSPFFHFCRAESESKVTAYWIKLDDSAQFDHEDIPLLMFSDYGFLAEDSDLITQHSVWIHENGLVL